MGLCNSKASSKPNLYSPNEELKEDPRPTKSPVNGTNGVHQNQNQQKNQQNEETEELGKFSPFFPFYSSSPAHSLFSKKSPAPSGNSTPKRFFKRPYPPPSPAKHIRAVLARRHGILKPNEASIPVDGAGLDKSFGFSKHFANKYELGDGIGRGHFGYTCAAKCKKGELKGQQVAVKVIPKAKMTTAIAIEDVRREVKLLRALSGHKNLVQFYDAYEDQENVYIVMELCEGGELLDRILSRVNTFLV